jgi:undecaprenyl diphosphate synthase
MDGNGRWAKQRGLPRTEGHRQGGERIKDVLDEAKKRGVEAITIFAFSTENWNRPKLEIEMLMALMSKLILKYTPRLIQDDVRVRFIGSREKMRSDSLKDMEQVEEKTGDCKSLALNIALDFGGRWDIVQAAKKVVKDVEDGKITSDDINEEKFGKYLSLADLPEPDLLIRTSGEQRISNFLLWDLAYAELYFTETFWPDFDASEFNKAIEIYQSRSRRFGAV